MTDNELNEAIATRVMGWKAEIEEGFWPNTEEVWRDTQGRKVWSDRDRNEIRFSDSLNACAEAEAEIARRGADSTVHDRIVSPV